MSATDELRAILDECGVEHFDGTETTLWGYEPTGEGVGAYRYASDEMANGRMQVRMFRLTPAQAVEATLGRGECHDCLGDIEPFECSECHRRSEFKFPNYCHYCGRKVVW